MHQYKYHIRLWGLKKNIPTSTKTKMFRIIEERTAMGKPTILEYKGREVNKKRLARLAKTQVNTSLGRTAQASLYAREGPVLKIANGM